jgi:hypothetical protein
MTAHRAPTTPRKANPVLIARPYGTIAPRRPIVGNIVSPGFAAVSVRSMNVFPRSIDLHFEAIHVLWRVYWRANQRATTGKMTVRLGTTTIAPRLLRPSSDSSLMKGPTTAFQVPFNCRRKREDGATRRRCTIRGLDLFLIVPSSVTLQSGLRHHNLPANLLREICGVAGGQGPLANCAACLQFSVRQIVVQEA